MLNRGITQTLINNQLNEISWEAEYDGNIANISLSDGRHHYDISLDNQDLEGLLNIPSINAPIHNRLEQDFLRETPLNANPYKRTRRCRHAKPDTRSKTHSHAKPDTRSKTHSHAKPDTRHSLFLSSPSPNEELVIPITINGAKKRRKTYKVYKRHK
jgi:hypothetical protein